MPKKCNEDSAMSKKPATLGSWRQSMPNEKELSDEGGQWDAKCMQAEDKLLDMYKKYKQNRRVEQTMGILFRQAVQSQ